MAAARQHELRLQSAAGERPVISPTGRLSDRRERRERMNGSVTHSEQLNELGAALAKAQATMRPAVKDATNPHFKSKYADLPAIWDACREALASNGLSVVQAPCNGDAGWLGLETTLLHSSGQWMTSTLFLPVSKADAQGYGSAMTYTRRYALAAMVGICSEDDDDGNAAASSAPRQQQQRAPESRGDAAATKSNGSGAITWQARCIAKLQQLFPQASGAAGVQLAIASAVIGKPVETFEGWEDGKHWRGYLERLEKLKPADVNRIVSEAFATASDAPAPSAALDLDVDPFDEPAPVSALAQGA